MYCVKICTVCTRKAIIKAAKRIFNSDKICRSYCDFYFGVTFSDHSVFTDIIGLFSTTVTYLVSRAIEFGEKCKISTITPFKVIQGHRGR